MLRLPKFLLSVFFVTFCALAYVHQQTAIFKFAYLGQRRLANFEDLLDKNSILRYNIKKNSSLISIGKRISEDAGLEIPNSYHLVRLNPQEELRLTNRPINKESIFSRILGIKREAQAKTLKP